jgi:hypothetical protein
MIDSKIVDYKKQVKQIEYYTPTYFNLLKRVKEPECY